ncbi:hypothetical protein POM88_033542 [Heracleum sosnowskyi]|uniref:Uncharacterized protein n=1 Tax=Heracleum sosnowskyi TaxID=360622 RepID=A0AAD8I1C4_9APIA|nr:hypothetical protein POM88_033542 [Heracleum sosnowskyi]
MDDFVLPPFESTLILNDKVIKILSGQFKFDHFVILANVSKCTEPLTRVPYGILKTCNAADSSEDFENVEEQPLDAGVPLPPDRLEAGGCEIESEEDAECSDNTEPSENLSPVNALHKERKASTELQSSKQKKPGMVVPNGMGKDNQTKSGDAWSGTYFKEDEKSDQLQENDQKTEDMSNVTDTTGKVPSRSARRKKAKRQWLRATVNIGKRKIVCKSKLPLKRKQRQVESENKEVIDQSKVHLHLKHLEQEEPEYKKDEESPTKRENLSNKIKYLWKQCSGMESPAREKGRNGAQRKFHWLRCMSTKTLTMIRPNISSTTEVEIPVHDTIDFDKLQPLENLPKCKRFPSEFELKLSLDNNALN